jgi:hypothetical protein
MAFSIESFVNQKQNIFTNFILYCEKTISLESTISFDTSHFDTEEEMNEPSDHPSILIPASR